MPATNARRPRTTLSPLGAATIVGAALALGAACGGEPAQVPERDQREILRAFVEDAQPLFRQGCFNVRRPVSDGTSSAYATLLRIAHRDPEAIIQSPDFVDQRWTAREYVVGRRADIAYCMDRSPRVDASWRQLKDRLDREVAALADG